MTFFPAKCYGTEGQSGPRERKWRTCGEEEHIALAGGLSNGRGDARLSRHAAVTAAKLHRAHETPAANVNYWIPPRQLQESLQYAMHFRVCESLAEKDRHYMNPSFC